VDVLGNTRGDAEWIRSPRIVALIFSALMVSLVFGTSFVVINAVRPFRADAFVRPAQPLSDDQTRAQVVESAKQIVTVAGLRDATGGYTLMSCADQHDPPYQGVVYMSFRLPHGNTMGYFREMASAMVLDGWRENSTQDQHFGRKLSKDGVTAIFYRNADAPGFGTMRLYGQCRNTSDHRDDTAGWTEISDQLG
jgi:hypothetical protein